jgi:hypothetical protein
MILEYTQLLSSAYYQGRGNIWKIPAPELEHKYKIVVRNPGETEFRIYAKTHYNHPSCVWTRASIHNWLYLLNLALALCAEFEYRWGKEHATKAILLGMRAPILPDIAFTGPTPAMDDIYKRDNSLDSYRNYYRNGKQHLHQYTKRAEPSWLK